MMSVVKVGKSGGWCACEAGVGTEKVGFTQYTWNGNRLLHIQHQDGDENVLADFDYDYDLGLRLTFKDDNGTSTTFGYDATNQLISAGDNEYSFDLAGNRSEAMGYITGPGNRLEFDGTWYYFYDAEGNLIEKNTGPTGESWTFDYDHRNRLISIKHWAAIPIEGPWQGLIGQWDYIYDVFGNRIQEDAAPGYLSPTTTTKFAYIGQDAWADLDVEFDLQARRFYLDGVDQLLARFDARGVAWYLTDHLGSVRGVTDDTGALQAFITFDEFGNWDIPTGIDVTYLDRYGFTAREFDPDTGLQYNRARFYDPMIGRWISEDPINIASGDPNFYRYVGNSPVNLSDPSGLKFLWTDYYWPWEEVASFAWQGSIFADAVDTVKAGAVAGWNWTADTATSAASWAADTATATWTWTINAVETVVSSPWTQAAFGLLEMIAGVLTIKTGAGFFLVVHGFDNLTTGLYRGVTGRDRDTLTKTFLKAQLELHYTPEQAEELASSLECAATLAAGGRTATPKFTTAPARSVPNEVNFGRAGRVVPNENVGGRLPDPLPGRPVAPRTGTKTVEDFLPQAQKQLEAIKRRYPGMEGVQAMAKKPDIKFIDSLQKELKLSNTQRELLHEVITGQNLTKQEIREVAKEIKELYPNKQVMHDNERQDSRT